ncbi:unnamed protein product [Phytophthora fragariaefolia]|uniref:Unnamed protein product n=1 Tax=Phytophthora fragariaefolia TaxID=1490495 RepID=A0A9W6YC23_9STRA|nr:unnamed protein product [Phytophthora fragariaefolia]
MGLEDLAPANSKRAQKTAIIAFERFLVAEDVNMAFIAACILGDTDGAVFVKFMDRFAVYLAFVVGRAGKPLARNSVMSYYRHVKNWFLDSYPKHGAGIEMTLLKMAQTLERYWLKRSEGGVTKKAPACTKEDLRILMNGIYYDASSSKAYQDAALLAQLQQAVIQNERDTTPAGPTELTKEERPINHQNCVIGELVSMNKELMKRIGAMEAHLASIETDGTVATTSTDAAHSSIIMPDKTIKVKPGGSRATSKSPAAV